MYNPSHPAFNASDDAGIQLDEGTTPYLSSLDVEKALQLGVPLHAFVADAKLALDMPSESSSLETLPSYKI